MANNKHTKEERKEFHDRLNEIYDEIPSDFLAKVLIDHPNIPSQRISSVRYGRTINFEILEILEKMVKQEIISNSNKL